MSNVLHVASKPYQPDQSFDGGSTVELGDLKSILLHRRGLILGTAALLTLAVMLYGLLTPALFSSTAQIIIDPRDRQVITNDINPSSISPDGGIAQVESQVTVAQSTNVLLRAIKATDLTRDPEFNSAGLLGASGGNVEALSDEDRQVVGSDVATVKTLDTLRRKMSVKRNDKVLVIDIMVTTKSPAKSAMLANAIASAYLADQAEARSQSASEASSALSARLEEQRRQVETAENAVERYKLDNNMVMTSGRLLSDQDLTEINTQLALAQSNTVALKARVDQIRMYREQGTSANVAAEAMQSDVLTQLRAHQATLENRATSLEAQLGPRHPAMLTAQSQMRNLQTLITQELSRIEASAIADYERAVSNEKTLAAKVGGLKGQSFSTSQASVRLRELERDLEAVRSIYANYLTRVQETREQVHVDTTNARIITQAMPAQRKSWPPLSFLLAGAMCGGLGLGAGLALLAEYNSPTILSGGQLRSALNIPLLGIVPGGGGAGRRRVRRAKAKDGAEQMMTGSPKTDGVIGLALRSIVDSERWQSHGGMAPAIVLTSRSEDEDHRMRIAGLFGAAFAARGERILIVDANMSVGARDPGLTDVLAGNADFDDVIHFRFGKNIAYMGRGQVHDLLNEKTIGIASRTMLRRASRMFDAVVIDGGNLSENLRAIPLAELASEVLLIAELNVTPLSNAVSMAQSMVIMGAPLTGSLLIDAGLRG
ncbi:GNVR domain-containing protein [Neorhizobium sp. JUb45]|uniref:GNVR domain-containing protein n=1 Tax=unclassified Neorhizobium TaxID=2629175 RepID=UPI00104849E6|nr:GNVR domain-containing protein [Neorhizobium sp. JUb45]TCQ98233.1 uncharacterized protein involved in exopolysaccharide biosynthesis [Neorhizobium sp. JUb45]